MKNISIVLFFLTICTLYSCKDSLESPNLTEGERNLIRHKWQGEGVYLQGVKLDSTVSRINLRFQSRSGGLIKDVSINGFLGGSWKLNGNLLHIKYPASLSAQLDSVTFTVTKLTDAELNLATNRKLKVFGITTLSPNVELRLIPKP